MIMVTLLQVRKLAQKGGSSELSKVTQLSIGESRFESGSICFLLHHYILMTVTFLNESQVVIISFGLQMRKVRLRRMN